MTQKEIAVDFLRQAAAGRARAAFARHAASGFRHHNACFKGDADSLMTAMDEGKTLDVKQAIEEGDRVAVLSDVKTSMECSEELACPVSVVSTCGFGSDSAGGGVALPFRTTPKGLKLK